MVRVASAAVIRRGTDTTVQHNVRRHASAVVLERGKARTSHARAGLGDALDGLQRLQVVTVVVVVSNDQVRLVGATNELDSQSVHVTLNRGVGHNARTADRGIKHLGLPERPHGAVDAAVGARGRVIRHSRSKAREVLARVAGAIAVQVARDAVSKLGFRDFHATVKQVNDGFLARVLDHFQTRDGHSRGVLRDAELRRRNRAVLADVQHLVSRVGIRVVGGRIVVHDFLQNHVTARERLDVPALLEATKQRVVVRHVVSEFTATALNSRGNDVADA